MAGSRRACWGEGLSQPGYEVVARQRDALARYIASSVTARRGLLARLQFFTRADHARRAALEADLAGADRTKV
ncbi:hypothetical protein ACFTY7_15005 [Streptomyces sp. NPDC057062]|uniref:hypothetical protein n=1 Tax=Streptomyces sp. NPDC057062 TaxID=3346011 RepID=UPI00363E91B1